MHVILNTLDNNFEDLIKFIELFSIKYMHFIDKSTLKELLLIEKIKKIDDWSDLFLLQSKKPELF